VLALRYLLDPSASFRGRLIVAAITLASFLTPPSAVGQIVSIIGQLGVALFGLFRLKLMASNR
jgi:hypothetical protein